MTDPYFKNAGSSRGLFYNIFCNGGAAGVDGRIYSIGLHDKGGNNGGRKVILDTKHHDFTCLYWRRFLSMIRPLSVGRRSDQRHV